MCQFVQAQIGTAADLPWQGPTTTANQTGQYLEITNWVNMAYKAIQIEQPDWLWRWKKAELDLMAGQNMYSLSDIVNQIPDFEDWKPLHFNNDMRYVLVYDANTGKADETFCYFYPYQDYRGWRDRSVVPTGKPAYLTHDPQSSGVYFEMSPIPDAGTGAGYVMVFDYRIAIEALGGGESPDNTTPSQMPPQYHESICWKALMYWALQRENSAKYAASKIEYDRIMNRMRMEQLPETEIYLREFY